MLRRSNDFNWDMQTGSPDLPCILHPGHRSCGCQERLLGPDPNPQRWDACTGLRWRKVGSEPARLHEDTNRHISDTTAMHI